MGLFSRKQGIAATTAALSDLTEADREHGMDLLEAAEGVFVDLGAPSQLGTAMFDVFARSVGFDEEGPAWGVAAGVSLMGYACRMAEPARAVPENIASAISGQLVFTASGTVDYEALANDPERLERLIEFIATLADNPTAIATLADASSGAWHAFATTATYQLHKNLVRNGLPRRALPSAETLENLLRLGYAIRVVDEVAGESPMDKSGHSLAQDGPLPAVVRDDGPVPSGPLDVDAWLSDAAGVCVSDFEPFAERVLELGTLERLEIVTVFDGLLGEEIKEEIGDNVITAMANARMGYALRNRETQLLDHSDFVARADPIAALLDERATNPSFINIAMLHAILRDILVLKFNGGPERLDALTPGTTAETRREAIERWANEHFPDDDPRTGRDVTRDLLEYGYYLHRLFEIRPDCLEDWS